jgi:ornithine carbamoyltransferase
VIAVNLKGRDLLRINDWEAADLVALLDLADFLKARQRRHVPHRHLEGRVLAMLFDKPSTRTRVSFAAAMTHLGGLPLPVTRDELQLGRGEPLSDTARILSGFVDGIVIRTSSQALVDELAEHASVPVINGLTDDFHPCQALADVMTIRERFGTIAGVRVAYLGDGNNVCHSLMVACAKLGASFVAATPPGYAPRGDVVEWARAAAADSGGSIDLLEGPRLAAEGADVLYTDVWTSMGQEAERDRRLSDLGAYRIDEGLLAHASERAIVMHCLPAHYGEEISEDIVNGTRSAVWEQAENRLHAQKALLALVVR